jgi:hypothetical protein
MASVCTVPVCCALRQRCTVLSCSRCPIPRIPAGSRLPSFCLLSHLFAVLAKDLLYLTCYVINIMSGPKAEAWHYHEFLLIQCHVD